MAVVGVDCHVVLDGQGYYVAPRSYQVARPRVRRSTLTVQGSECWVDRGPGKRVWRFAVLALNDLQAYGGGPVGMTGEAIRAALEVSYARVGTALAFVDPQGDTYSVRFDGLVEVVRDVRTQLIAPGYLLAVELVEV